MGATGVCTCMSHYELQSWSTNFPAVEERRCTKAIMPRGQFNMAINMTNGNSLLESDSGMHALVHESLAILADSIGLTECPMKCHDRELAETLHMKQHHRMTETEPGPDQKVLFHSDGRTLQHRWGCDRDLTAHVLLEQVRSPMGDFLQDRHC